MMHDYGMAGMMFWMPIGMLLFIVLVVVAVWLLVRWLDTGKISRMQYTPASLQQPYQPYEQGYQVPSQQAQEVYQEGGPQYHYQEPKQSQYQYEQPQAQYPQEQEMPPQH